MDRQISKSQLRREKFSLITKYFGAIAAIILIGVVVSSQFIINVKAKDVMLSTASVGEIEITVNASGKVVPAFEEIINSPITSRIIEVYKKSGDLVEAGTPILRLDLQSIEIDYKKMLDQQQVKQLELEQLKLQNINNISNLEMNLKVQRMEVENKYLELNNQRYLDSLGAGTAAQVRQAETSYMADNLQLKENELRLKNERALAISNEKIKELELSILDKELSQMRTRLEDSRIKAPTSAVLSYVNTTIGAQVSQGEKIAMLSDLSRYRIDGEINAANRDKISVGSRAKIKAGRDYFNGVVSNLNPVSSNNVIDFSIQLDENNHPKLRSGLNCDIYIIESVINETIRIKNGTYYKHPDKYQLFVLEGNMLKRREVVLGESNFEYVEVISGIKEGEKVLISDIGKSKEREKIRYKESKKEK